jgi:hypothetical protein
LVYADEMPADLKKGEMDELFGLKVNEPFHIISQMSSERYIDLVGRNMVIKTRNGLPSQEWFFDGKTKTIKSMRTKSYSWNIKNSGRTNNMEVYNTNSRWFQLFVWLKDEGQFWDIHDKRIIDVAGNKDEEAANIVLGKDSNKKSNKWKLVYTKDAKPI